MATLSERLHGRRGLWKEEDGYVGGAVPELPEAGIDPDAYHYGADPALTVEPSYGREFVKEAKKQLGEGIGLWKERLGRVSGTAPVGTTTSAAKELGKGTLRALSGLGGKDPAVAAAQRKQQQLGEQFYKQPEQQVVAPAPVSTVDGQGAVRKEVAPSPVGGVAPVEYGAEGQAALTGMSQGEKMWVRQKALTHSNPNIRAWAQNWKDGGVVKEGDTTHVPVFDRNTGMPVINPKTGEMEHISIARHGVKDEVVDPGVAIAGAKIKAEKEMQATKLGAGEKEHLLDLGMKQAGIFHKSADTILKNPDVTPEDRVRAADYRKQGNRVYEEITGRKVPTKTPTEKEMETFTIETDPIKLRITRKHFVDAGEAGKAKFQSLPRAARDAIFPPRR